MQKIFNNLTLIILSILVSACNMDDFYRAAEQAATTAKIICDGKYKDNVPLLKACKNGVEHLKYAAFNSESPLGEIKVVEDAKTLCQISYPTDQDRFNACLKGIHFLFIERDFYAVNSPIGEQGNTSALAISESQKSFSDAFAYLDTNNSDKRSEATPLL